MKTTTRMPYDLIYSLRMMNLMNTKTPSTTIRMPKSYTTYKKSDIKDLHIESHKRGEYMIVVTTYSNPTHRSHYGATLQEAEQILTEWLE